MTLPGIFSKVSTDLFWHFGEDEKKIYLTFDDGPTKEITYWILNTLEHYQAKATFFCLGKNAEQFKSQYQSILNAGHVVGNHTYCHLTGWFTKNRNYFQDIQKAGEHINSNLFRPPHGRIKISQIQYLKQRYKIVLWDVLSKDYNKKFKPEEIIQRVIRLSRPGSVVVFHDSEKAEKNLKQALPQILEYFHNKGYTFSSIPFEQTSNCADNK